MSQLKRTGVAGRILGAALALLLGAATAGSAAPDLEDELEARWRGAWVVTSVIGYSACGGSYTDNRVRGRLVTSRGDLRFEPGEVAQVHKISLERKKVEVFLDLEEPVLRPWRDGPFTLYDERFCKIEYEIPLPGGRRGADLAEVEALISGLLERHEDPHAARASQSWNRRLRDPYPPDYERTLREHEIWKIRQTNAAVGEAIRRASEEAARIVDRLDDDPEYLEGFAAGVDGSRDEYRSRDCESLLSESHYVSVKAPKDRSRPWREGYEEGWRLVHHLERGRLLHGCFIPEPE